MMPKKIPAAYAGILLLCLVQDQNVTYLYVIYRHNKSGQKCKACPRRKLCRYLPLLIFLLYQNQQYGKENPFPNCLTTILSMIPLAIGVGENGALMQGMAVVIVGGLIASTMRQKQQQYGTNQAEWHTEHNHSRIAQRFKLHCHYHEYKPDSDCNC